MTVESGTLAPWGFVVVYRRLTREARFLGYVCEAGNLCEYVNMWIRDLAAGLLGAGKCCEMRVFRYAIYSSLAPSCSWYLNSNNLPMFQPQHIKQWKTFLTTLNLDCIIQSSNVATHLHIVPLSCFFKQFLKEECDCHGSMNKNFRTVSQPCIQILT